MMLEDAPPGVADVARRQGSGNEELTVGDAGNFAETRFMTVTEVAEMMRVSRMTVYRMIHAGELPAVRFGRSYRVPESAVEEILQTGTTDVRVTGTEDRRG
jgi:excisionase family DNA binding protein